MGDPWAEETGTGEVYCGSDENIRPDQMMDERRRETKAFHVKVYCEFCGKMLIHQRVEPPPVKRMAHFVQLSVHPCSCVVPQG